METLHLYTGKMMILSEQIYYYQVLEEETGRGFRDMERVKEDIELFLGFLKEPKVYLITDFQKLKKAIPKEVRELVIGNLKKYLIASAVVVGTPLSRIIINLAFSFQRTAYPRKIFTDAKKAEKWLRDMKNKNES